MAERYEYYNTGDDGAADFYGVYWKAQTFTPSVAHKITSVKLKLYRKGLPGTVTVSIRATDGEGHPTDDVLCSGTTDGDTLTEETAGEWREITLGSGYDLNVDIKYAIVARMGAGSSSIQVRWRVDETSPTYARGNYEWSSFSGTLWESNPGKDFMFEDWGEAIAPPGWTGKISGVTNPAKIMGVDVANIAKVKGVA